MKGFSLTMAIAGIALLVASFVWPSLDDGRSVWTEEKSQAYSEVSSRSHAAAVELASKPASEESKRRAEETYAEFQAMKAELDRARSRGSRTAFWLKIVGGVLAALGGVGYLMQREGS